ncbi:GDP-L-fucose synthase [Radicibacter daui]|uniref:GDP-L-fucose synthase n=1 Tax=Radicibacter daui TaxID=3064829 RepID=UPI00404690A8
MVDAAQSGYSLSGKKIWVAGHRGMVGSAIARRFLKDGYEVLTVARSEVDLSRQQEVEQWVERSQPDVVVVAAAKVGGIHANNSLPVDFLYDNLMIEANIINAAHQVGVEKLLFLGSSCIYPRLAPQPMAEDMLLTGPLEPTNQWYAVAKIAGIKLCQAYRRQYGRDYISAMPTNLYGPGDNFDLSASHVLPALLRKIEQAKAEDAKEVELWGTGTPLREFLYVDDLADACLYLIRHYSAEEHINVGTGEEVSIRELAETLAKVIGWDGRFVFNTDKPDGSPRKLMDSSRLHELGWKHRTSLEAGIRQTLEWYRANKTGGARL